MRDGVTGLISAMVFASTMAIVACADYGGSGNVGTAGTAGTTSAVGGNTSNGGQTSVGGSGGAANGGSTAATGGTSSCSSGTPCGGDVVGTWKVTLSCLTVTGQVDISLASLGCTKVNVTGAVQVTGTLTVNMDGTYTDGTSTSGDQQLTLPAACLDVSATTTTCDRVGNGLVSVGYTTATCTSDTATGGCNCTAHAGQQGSMGFVSASPVTDGLFTISGSTFTGGDGLRTVMAYPYCISGTTLTMTPQPTYPTLSGTVVLQKQ